MNGSLTDRRGLTPIEVLGAASLLSLAAALIVPAAGQNRNLRQLTHENGNLRVLAQLMAKYASDDPDGVLGPVHPEAANFIYEGYADYGGGPGTMTYVAWGEEFDPRTRPMNYLLYGRDAITRYTRPGDRSYFRPFQCMGNDMGWQKWPNFGTDPRETETPYFEGNGVSFRMNNLQWDNSNTGGGVGSPGEVGVFGIYGRSISRIPVPSETVAFMEARAFQTLFTNNVWGFIEPGELTSYHGKLGYFNLVYSDGHAAFADMGDDTYFQHKIEYDELDARGTWGRFDCYPAVGQAVLSSSPSKSLDSRGAPAVVRIGRAKP